MGYYDYDKKERKHLGEYSYYREKELREMEKYYKSDKKKCSCKKHPNYEEKCYCEEKPYYEEKCCCDKKPYYKEKCRCEEKHCCDKKDSCDNKHDDKKHDQKKDNADLTDFEFYTLPRNVHRRNRHRLPRDRQEAVASVTLDKVKKGDLVWLNGVFGLDNDDGDDNARIIMRVFKGNPPVFVPGSEIYRAVIEIEDGGNDDRVVEPLAHVDVIKDDDKDVTYTVTLESDERPVFLSGPVTFTAAQIRKDKK